MKTIFISFALLVLLFIVGWFLHATMIKSSIQSLELEKSHVILQSTEMTSIIKNRWIFALAIALTSLLYVLVRIKTHRTKLKEAALIIGFMITGGCFFLFARIQFIKWTIADFEIIPSIEPTISLEKLQFEWYFLIGVLFGAVISFVIFKWIRPKKVLNPTENFER